MTNYYFLESLLLRKKAVIMTVIWTTVVLFPHKPSWEGDSSVSFWAANFILIYWHSQSWLWSSLIWIAPWPSYFLQEFFFWDLFLLHLLSVIVTTFLCLALVVSAGMSSLPSLKLTFHFISLWSLSMLLTFILKFYLL